MSRSADHAISMQPTLTARTRSAARSPARSPASIVSHPDIAADSRSAAATLQSPNRALSPSVSVSWVSALEDNTTDPAASKTTPTNPTQPAQFDDTLLHQSPTNPSTSMQTENGGVIPPLSLAATPPRSSPQVESCQGSLSFGIQANDSADTARFNTFVRTSTAAVTPGARLDSYLEDAVASGGVVEDDDGTRTGDNADVEGRFDSGVRRALFGSSAPSSTAPTSVPEVGASETSRGSAAKIQQLEQDNLKKDLEIEALKRQMYDKSAQVNHLQDVVDQLQNVVLMKQVPVHREQVVQETQVESLGVALHRNPSVIVNDSLETASVNPRVLPRSMPEPVSIAHEHSAQLGVGSSLTPAQSVQQASVLRNMHVPKLQQALQYSSTVSMAPVEASVHVPHSIMATTAPTTVVTTGAHIHSSAAISGQLPLVAPIPATFPPRSIAISQMPVASQIYTGVPVPGGIFPAPYMATPSVPGLMQRSAVLSTPMGVLPGNYQLQSMGLQNPVLPTHSHISLDSTHSRASEKEVSSVHEVLVKALKETQASDSGKARFKMDSSEKVQGVHLRRGARLTSDLVIQWVDVARALDSAAGKAKNREPDTPAEWKAFFKFYLNHMEDGLHDVLMCKVNESGFTSTAEFWCAVFHELFPKDLVRDAFDDALRHYLIWNEPLGIERWEKITRLLIQYLCMSAGMTGERLFWSIEERMLQQLVRVIHQSEEKQSQYLLGQFLNFQQPVLMAEAQGRQPTTVEYQLVIRTFMSWLTNWLKLYSYEGAFGHDKAVPVGDNRVPDLSIRYMPKPPASSSMPATAQSSSSASATTSSNAAASYAQLAKAMAHAASNPTPAEAASQDSKANKRFEKQKLSDLGPTGKFRTWNWKQRTFPDEGPRLSCNGDPPADNPGKLQYLGDWLDINGLYSYYTKSGHIKFDCPKYLENQEKARIIKQKQAEEAAAAKKQENNNQAS